MRLFRAVVLITALVSRSCISDQGTTKSCSGGVCPMKCELSNIQLLNELIDGRVRNILQLELELASSTGKELK